MVISSADAKVLVDLAVNAPPDLPASASPAGPTLAPEELAGHKLLALFDRAAARDFADVYVLAHRFGKDALLARAAQIDAGFDAKVLADMIATLDRFTDDEIPVPDDSSAAELRGFYAIWRSELAA
jgi:predicted nucleotidyltransferase component of viral defense system